VLWEGKFESLEQLREFYRVMQPLYSTTAKAEGFDDGWNRSRRSFVALNQGFGDFLRTFDFTEALHRISCPTLVIAGAHDWICPVKHSQIIASRVPKAHLKVFAKSSHSVAA